MTPLKLRRGWHAVWIEQRQTTHPMIDLYMGPDERHMKGVKAERLYCDSGTAARIRSDPRQDPLVGHLPEKHRPAGSETRPSGETADIERLAAPGKPLFEDTFGDRLDAWDELTGGWVTLDGQAYANTGGDAVMAIRGRRIAFWARTERNDRKNPPQVDDITIVSTPQDDWLSAQVAGGPPHRRCDVADPGGWLGIEHPARHWLTQWHRRTWGHHSGNFGIASGADEDDAYWAVKPRDRIRDCVIIARCEFVGQPSRGYESAFSLLFRSRGRSHTVAKVRPEGGAEVWYRSVRGTRYWDTDRIAASHGFVPPSGVFRVVAFVQGTRLELHCGGRHVLTTDKLREGDGQLGYKVEGATVIVHDFKWRPLPTDPLFGKLMAQGAGRR